MGDEKLVTELKSVQPIRGDYESQNYETNVRTLMKGSQIKRQQSHVKREVIR